MNVSRKCRGNASTFARIDEITAKSNADFHELVYAFLPDRYILRTNSLARSLARLLVCLLSFNLTRSALSFLHNQLYPASCLTHFICKLNFNSPLTNSSRLKATLYYLFSLFSRTTASCFSSVLLHGCPPASSFIPPLPSRLYNSSLHSCSLLPLLSPSSSRPCTL